MQIEIKATKLSWATDLHLDFLGGSPESLTPFIKKVQAQQPDLLLLAGDIDTALASDFSFGVVGALKKIKELLRCPVFFVLGNHDFYGSSIAYTETHSKFGFWQREIPRD